MFDSWTVLVLGLASGFVFGFLLQKSGVTQFATIINQFRLRDFTVLKTMLTAIVVGGLGIAILSERGLATLSIKPAFLIANITGGLIFGVGMTLAGFCPGTAIAAIGERNSRAAVGLIGMLVGAWIQIETYNPIRGAVRSVDLGPLAMPECFGVSRWEVLAVVAVLALVVFLLLEAFNKPKLPLLAKEAS